MVIPQCWQKSVLGDPNSVLMDTSNYLDIVLSIRGLGYVAPVSHRLIACLVTHSFSAICSCVRLLALRILRMISLSSILIVFAKISKHFAYVKKQIVAYCIVLFFFVFGSINKKELFYTYCHLSFIHFPMQNIFDSYITSYKIHPKDKSLYWSSQ